MHTYKFSKTLLILKQEPSRTDYWAFFLVHVLVCFLLVIIGQTLMTNRPDSLPNIYTAIIILPSISLAIRRMHDVGKSWWYSLIPIYSIYLATVEGDKGENKYGQDPNLEL